MTKEITKAIILQEMQDKLKLREFDPAKFLFDETVIPIYDIGAHVKNWESIRHRLAVSGNGVLYFASTTESERWRVRKIDVYSEAGGNFDIDQIFLYGGTGVHQYLFYNTAAPIAAGTVNMFSLSQDIPMERGVGHLYSLALNISNFVAGGYISVHMLREVETLR